jgi:hypothetical protein
MIHNTPKHDEPKLRTVLRDDFGHGDFFKTMQKEFADLREYFLTEHRKQQLTSMSVLKKLILIPCWLVKSLLLKLNWIRRLFLLAAGYFMVNPISFDTQGGYVRVNQNTYWLGFLLVLFVLMLELKDKLLAKSELAAGRTVQEALMPETEPYVPGWSLWLYYRPANEVCGDLLDFLSIEEWRSAIALGDVSDKGLGAALLMVKLQATLRALAPDQNNLAQLAAKMNEIYLRDKMSKSFASLVYLQLHPDSGSVQLFNAGHPPPLLIHEKKILELPKGDTALGLLAHAEFREQQVDLESGDVLFVYSDGLTEARNGYGEFFGDPRLHSLLRNSPQTTARALGETILAAVEAFIEDTPNHDDLSMAILVKR